MAQSNSPEERSEVSRRQLIKLGAAAAATGPAILKVRAATDQVKFGMVGTGSRGTYLLQHLARMDSGRCVALCDLDQDALDNAANIVKTNPKKYKDYRELLADKDVEAVLIAVPLYVHFPVTRDSLLAGKHTFCEKSLVFKPDEVHALRALAAQHPKQTLQVGLQRRYSVYFQSVKNMIDNGILGDVTHMHAQWHRNPGWTMKPGGKGNPKNWRLFRDTSGGLTAELASHQVDVANWYFGAHPDFVVGVGGLDTWRDGRDIYDNIQLIYSFPKGRKLTYSAISTCQHLSMLCSERPEFGIVVMGTAGAVEMNVGSDNALPTALWYREPKPTLVSPATQRTETTAGATFALSGPQKGIPILTPETQVDWKKDSFFTRESKLARRWLYSKGILLPEEERNPVDTELESFLKDSRTGARPKADVEVGLSDSTAVILSNIAMDEGRRVYFSEIDNLGTDVNAAMSRQIA
ncbi:MAG TPA: Gfo/Idh/MocA family oxidoreductase [Bryobacteraceae bacterium]|jgi:predicted dehydrogenase|nr:Gfo/Idh/MocA family oxidoreductase [Bryobacteraceae bacterium]